MSRFTPILVLALLATAVPEVLFGSTPLNQPGRILATMPIYAGGAILIRELARRRQVGWLQIAILGAAYGVVEEGVALGSLFNPTLFNAGLVGGRLLGVNWTWTEWTLGYHAIWSISIPILLTELIFPARRVEPWLGKVGLVVAGLVYLAGVAFLTAIMRLVVTPGADLTPVQYAAAGLVVVGLCLLGLGRTGAGQPRTVSPSDRPTRVPSPWLIALLALLTAGAWFELLLLPAPVKSGAWVVVPMLLALALLASVVTLVRRWSGRPGWTDVHRLALAAGPLPISMAYGTVYVTSGDPTARAGQIAACGLAVILLIVLARHLRDRAVVGNVGEARPSADRRLAHHAR